MEFIELIALSGLVAFVVMTIFYVISLIKEDAGVVDIAWGLGFIAISVVTMFLNVNFVERSNLVMALVFVWGLRLGIHIYLRNRGKKEDWRYAKWRKDWGDAFRVKSFVNVFMLQALLMTVISVPVVFVHSIGAEGLGVLDWIGVGVWLVGFFFETVSDYQLMKFKSLSKNRGKVLTDGLWKYSRHPNYFGEVAMWWGIFLIALSLPKGVYTIVGPAFITYLILFVSGVPLLEKKYMKKKAFTEYAAVTSIFVPWFPKKKMQDKV